MQLNSAGCGLEVDVVSPTDPEQGEHLGGESYQTACFHGDPGHRPSPQILPRLAHRLPVWCRFAHQMFPPFAYLPLRP
ncbi:MAG: hypothetical protein H5U04_00115 [Firmicutes bacterium]|nr:hypothetical protein [Bacillota bacterium]